MDDNAAMPSPSPSPTAGRLLLLAAVLTVAALGLSWRGEAGTVAGYTTPGTFTPGSCVTTYDYEGYGTVECSTGTYYPGYYSAGYDPTRARGADLEFRAFAAVAWGLVLLDGRVVGSGRARRFAPMVLGGGVVLTGLASGPGCFVAIAATAVLWLALRGTTPARSPATTERREPTGDVGPATAF